MFKSAKAIDAIRRRCNDVENELIDAFLAGRIVRREFLRHAALLGISAPFVAGLVGCADAQSYPLDLVPGAAIAYSFRKLRTAYAGSPVRARRSSDAAEQDIPFAGKDYDNAAMVAFQGASPFLLNANWYDQGTHGNNGIGLSGHATSPQPTAGRYANVTSNGVDLWQQVADNATIQDPWLGGGFLLCVFSLASAAGQGSLASKKKWVLYTYPGGAGAQLWFYFRGSPSDGFFGTTDSFTVGPRHVVTFSWDQSNPGTNPIVTIDGTVAVIGSVQNATPTSDATFAFEAQNDTCLTSNARPIVGAMDELLLYKGKVPSEANRNALIASAKTFYGIP